MSVSLPSGVGPAAGGGAAAGSDGARAHLPSHVFLPPAGWQHTGRPHKAARRSGPPRRSINQGGRR